MHKCFISFTFFKMIDIPKCENFSLVILWMIPLTALGSSLVVNSYPNISLVPEGYEMWATMADSVNMYLVERDKVCEMTIDENNWLVFQVRYLWEPRGEWKRLVKLLDEQNATSVLPVTCFWRKNGPNFVVRLDQHYSKLYLWADESFDFSFDYDLMTLDVETQKFYVYMNNKLFRMKVEEFIEVVRQSELFGDQIAQVRHPMYQSKIQDWQDLMVVNGRIYFVHDGYIYQMDNGQEYLLSRTFDFRHCTIYWENVETFNYVLNPVYEDTFHPTTGPMDDLKLVASNKRVKRSTAQPAEHDAFDNSTSIQKNFDNSTAILTDGSVLKNSLDTLYILMIGLLFLFGIAIIAQGVFRLIY